jgi:CheY-like chemotaxis protein
VARFEVTDTGVGIAADDLERIFQPFVRIQGHGIPHVHGTGLGLTIVKLMTEIMGGELRVDSEPARGSRFGLSILLSSADPGLPQGTGSRQYSGYRGRRRQVMVVDDDPDFRTLAGELLGSIGFLVTAVGSSSACLESLDEVEPDLVLLDVNLPDGHGLELARELRRRELACPVIMVSAQAYEQPERSDGSADHDAYLVKPVSETLLLTSVGELLLIDWETAQRTSAAPPVLERETSEVADPAPSTTDIPDHPSIRELVSCARMGYRSGVLALLDEIDAARLLPDNRIRELRQLASHMQFVAMADLLDPAATDVEVSPVAAADGQDHSGVKRS